MFKFQVNIKIYSDSPEKFILQKKFFFDKFLGDLYAGGSTTGVETLEEEKMFHEKTNIIFKKVGLDSMFLSCHLRVSE